MARFKAPRIKTPGLTKTINLAGGQAFDRSPKVELASLIATSMVMDTFYEKAEMQLDRIADIAAGLAKHGDLAFCAKAALYSRHKANMRSASHALAGEVAQLRYLYPAQRGTWGPGFFEKIVFRADDASEIAGYWLTKYCNKKPKTLPAAMKRGFAAVLAKTPAHLLAKWNGASTRTLTLRQLCHLVHPNGPRDSAIWKLRGGILGAADTHEVVISRAGQAENPEAAKAEGWGRLFAEGKIKYMAALRGAKRILKDAPECVPALCEKLASASDVEGSKVMPFQLLIARDQLQEIRGADAQRVIEAIDTGMDHAMRNVPSLPGRTLIALDASGSMNGRPFLIGAVFATAFLHACEYAEFRLFSDRVVGVRLDKRAALSTNVQLLAGGANGGGTDFHLIFNTAREAWDRIIILSDMQGWMGFKAPTTSLAAYEQRVGCKPRIYTWDVVQSASCQFPQDRVVMLAGLTPRVFELISAIEQDPAAMVAAIEAVEL